VHSGVDNWAKSVILEEGLTPTILQMKADELQFIEGRKLNREECCAAYDMPPPAVHILDRATFSNITEQFRSLYRDTMAPRLGMYESTLQHQLAIDFAFEGPVYAEFLLDEVLRGDFEQRAAAVAQAIQTGQLMPSEAREMDNRPFVEGSDRLLSTRRSSRSAPRRSSRRHRYGCRAGAAENQDDQRPDAAPGPRPALNRRRRKRPVGGRAAAGRHRRRRPGAGHRPAVRGPGSRHRCRDPAPVAERHR
jgi:hypothetical protein